MDNTGYIQQDRVSSDWSIGGQGDFFTPLKSLPLIGRNDWSDYLPVIERQNNGGYDRMACVSYSILNCLEILHLFKEGKEANFSDRYLAKMSNTTRFGNSVPGVFDTIRTEGLVSEEEWPDSSDSWDKYYEEIPLMLKERGRKFLDKWSVYREYVPTYNKDLIFEAINHAPLQVICRYAAGEGILSPIGEHNHAVTCYGAVKGKYWMIYDHYTQTRKKYDWSYEFSCIVKPTMELKNVNTSMKIKNGYLYLLVEGYEQRLGMGLDGKLVVYKDKIDGLINSSSRLGKFEPAIPITLKDWDLIKKIDGKGNEIK